MKYVFCDDPNCLFSVNCKVEDKIACTEGLSFYGCSSFLKCAFIKQGSSNIPLVGSEGV